MALHGHHDQAPRTSGRNHPSGLQQCRSLLLIVVSLTWLLQGSLLGQVVGQPSPLATSGTPCKVDEQILTSLVNRAKAEVAQIAQRALDNEFDCGLLRSCAVSRPPAVLACTGVTSQADNLTCVNTVTQPNVTQCFAQACHNEYLGFNFASTQLPPGISVARATGAISSSKDYEAAVCKANFLDLFQKMVVYNQSSTFGNWRYYADAYGVFHKFPFQAVTQVAQSTPSDFVQCRPYDPRRRPWFSGAISSRKSIVVLIDVGATSSASASSTGLPVVSRLQVAKDTAAALIDTLSKGDEVAVLSFDINVTAGTRQQVTTFDSPHTDLAGLIASIDNLTSTSYNSSGLSNAILAGLQVRTKILPECQKILIVLSDGEGVGPTLNGTALNLAIDTASAEQQQLITTFFVAIGENTIIGNTVLQALACSVQGVYMRVASTENILSDLYPYFNYLARISQFVNQQYVSEIYPDFFGLGPVFTVAQPVFDTRTGDFLGVAAGDTAASSLLYPCAEDFVAGLRPVQGACPLSDLSPLYVLRRLHACVLEAVRGVNNTYCPVHSLCSLRVVPPACDVPSIPIPNNVLRPPGPSVSPMDNYCCGSCNVTSPPAPPPAGSGAASTSKNLKVFGIVLAGFLGASAGCCCAWREFRGECRKKGKKEKPWRQNASEEFTRMSRVFERDQPVVNWTPPSTFPEEGTTLGTDCMGTSSSQAVLCFHDFTTMQRLPSHLPHEKARLRRGSGRECLILKGPDAFLKIPLDLTTSLKSHSLIFSANLDLVGVPLMLIGLESRVNGVFLESLEYNGSRWSFLSSEWGKVTFNLRTSEIIQDALETQEPKEHFLVGLVVDFEKETIELYVEHNARLKHYSIDMFDEPAIFPEGRLEVALRNTKTGCAWIKFVALHSRAMRRAEMVESRKQ